jgi:hypothetical protein
VAVQVFEDVQAVLGGEDGVAAKPEIVIVRL